MVVDDTTLVVRIYPLIFEHVLYYSIRHIIMKINYMHAPNSVPYHLITPHYPCNIINRKPVQHISKTNTSSKQTIGTVNERCLTRSPKLLFRTTSPTNHPPHFANFLCIPFFEFHPALVYRQSSGKEVQHFQGCTGAI